MNSLIKLDLHRRIREVVKIRPCRVGAPSKKPCRFRKQVWLEPPIGARNRLGRK